MNETPETAAEARYARLFRRAHAGHASCQDDPWLMEACRSPGSEGPDRALVWSRRNGPWSRHETLWVGAAPGNAGGMGSGSMGAHGTRIPFGGDIAGANLDVLLSGSGLDRNRTFIVAALNQLPDRGGGEPRVAELRRPVGEIESSFHLLRETLLATAPRMVVALGNVAVRTTIAAARLEEKSTLTLPGLKRLEKVGLERGRAVPWPGELSPDPAFVDQWREIRPGAPLPHILWLLHPSAQNMSPFAGTDTVFHGRMVETLEALRRAMAEVLGREVPDPRPGPPAEGIYALPEWRDAVGPRHAELDELWRAKGI